MIIRCVAALFGSITAPLVYFITRHWNGSVRASLLAAVLILFDNLNLTESRLILMDSQLMFWIALCMLSALKWWERLNAHADAEASFFQKYGLEFNADSPAHLSTDPRFLSKRNHLRWLVWMGFMCAQAISIKWTGLATPGVIALESFFGFGLIKRPIKMRDGLVIAGVAFVVYTFWFWCHFLLLPNTGDGDGFMPVEFQRTLINNTFYDVNAPKPPFLVNFMHLNKEMLLSNSRITQRHHWETLWWEWPLNLRGLLYYSRDMGHSYTRTIYLLGNPAVIWLVTACIFFSLAALAIYWRYRQFGSLTAPQYAMLDRWGPAFARIVFCIAAYAFNMLPYLAIARSCFIYHYMPALLYGQVLTALFLDALAGRKYMPVVFKTVCLTIITVWLFYFPWVYCFPLTNDGHQRRRLLKRWD
jgi:dolichyl-phosphate-mannose--protein O-mannosyl transferase